MLVAPKFFRGGGRAKGSERVARGLDTHREGMTSHPMLRERGPGQCCFNRNATGLLLEQPAGGES